MDLNKIKDELLDENMRIKSMKSIINIAHKISYHSDLFYYWACEKRDECYVLYEIFNLVRILLDE